MELRTVLALASGDRAHKALQAIASRRSHLSSSNSERVGSSKPRRIIDINSQSGNSQARSHEGKPARLEATCRFGALYRSLFSLHTLKPAKGSMSRSENVFGSYLT